MTSLETQDMITLARTGHEEPRKDACDQATIIYHEYAQKSDSGILLAHFSLLIASDFDDQLQHSLFNDKSWETLVNRRYLDPTTNAIPDRMTLKARVAFNMIFAEVDDGSLSSYVDEPFENHEIIDGLYRSHLQRPIKGLYTSWLSN